ncbi:MAG: class I SAM-dependent methyltransferase [Clostridiales bacterium]|nr:class I SAM-dependent methyltransferase [Clostridiales bacterium]MCF8022353.1 class I SAM-dependent methyltransferase [Clostridiales bacterium]
MTTEAHYEKNAFAFYNNTVNVDMTELYIPFLRLIKKGGHILDAGCGSGRDSLYFLNHGYEITALDSSKALAELASGLINRKVLHMRLQDIDFEQKFDGIWACASLLHVSRKEMDDVLKRLIKALNNNGILYASFKYGDKEETVKDNRFFNCYDEKSSGELLERHPALQLIERWTTSDVRPGKTEEKWLNILLKKATETY